MADQVDLKDTKRFLRGVQKQVRTALRKEAARVRKTIRSQVRSHRRSGQLERHIKVRTGIDSRGAWARVTTGARNPKTKFRYGLAIQQDEHYMQRGLQRTPRR